MKVILSLETEGQIKAALRFCAEIDDEDKAIVMYKPEFSYDDDYIAKYESDWMEYEGSFDEFIEGCTNWELWLS